MSLKTDVKTEPPQKKKKLEPSLIMDQNDETDKHIYDSKIPWPLNNRVERKTERVTLMTQWENIVYTKSGGNSKTENTKKRHDDVVGDYSSAIKIESKLQSAVFTKCTHCTVYSTILILLLDAR